MSKQAPSFRKATSIALRVKAALRDASYGFDANRIECATPIDAAEVQHRKARSQRLLRLAADADRRHANTSKNAGVDLLPTSCRSHLPRVFRP